MKQKVLSLLKENNDKYISGALMAKELGVSRAAVWKAVEALRKDGYRIDAVSNSGYRLENQNEVIDTGQIVCYLRTSTFGRAIELYPETDSTNDLAKEKAKAGAADGTLILARKQNSGRGRYGRTFYSPENGGAYMSLIMRPNYRIEDTPFITIIAAVAVCNALKAICGIDATVKWVNDIFIGRKKVCGILTEASFEVETASVEYAVLGIGVNVFTKDFPDELDKIAGSVSDHAQKEFSINELIAEILNELEGLYLNHSRESILNAYRQYSCVLNREIYFIYDGIKTTGKAMSIDDQGGLEVKTNDGRLLTLQSGEVSIRFDQL